MYTVTFTGFATAQQAQAFAEWYEGQGEQDAATWMEESAGVSSCNTRNFDKIGEGHFLLTLAIVEAKNDARSEFLPTPTSSPGKQ